MVGTQDSVLRLVLIGNQSWTPNVVASSWPRDWSWANHSLSQLLESWIWTWANETRATGGHHLGTEKEVSTAEGGLRDGEESDANVDLRQLYLKEDLPLDCSVTWAIGSPFLWSQFELGSVFYNRRSSRWNLWGCDSTWITPPWAARQGLLYFIDLVTDSQRPELSWGHTTLSEVLALVMSDLICSSMRSCCLHEQAWQDGQPSPTHRHLHASKEGCQENRASWWGTGSASKTETSPLGQMSFSLSKVVCQVTHGFSHLLDADLKASVDQQKWLGCLDHIDNWHQHTRKQLPITYLPPSPAKCKLISLIPMFSPFLRKPHSSSFSLPTDLSVKSANTYCVPTPTQNIGLVDWEHRRNHSIFVNSIVVHWARHNMPDTFQVLANTTVRKTAESIVLMVSTVWWREKM